MKSLCIRNWCDLSEKQRTKAFRLMNLLLAGKIEPEEFRIQVLVDFFGGYPQRVKWWMKFIMWVILPKTKYHKWLDDVNFEDDLSEFIFIRSAEELKFAFELDGKTIIPNYNFSENPFCKISKKPPVFTRKYTVDTNITAKQFSDCLDLLKELNSDLDDETRKYLLVKLAEVLYKITYKQAEQLKEEILLGISFWFTGIVLFFQKHPIYSILFSSTKVEDEDDKIKLGMSETILHLLKEGYADTPGMNIVDFFDAQIKSLKDSISSSIAAGVKIEEIAQKTGLDYSTINRLN